MVRKRGFLWLALAAVALFSASCGEQDNDFSGADVTTAIDVQGADAATDDTAAEDTAAETTASASLTVSVDGVESTIVLADVALSGDGTIVLADVLLAVDGSLELSGFLCDFVAGDGFRTSSRGEGCEPVLCDATADAWVDPITRDLAWDPELNMRGCYQPRDLARVEMTTLVE